MKHISDTELGRRIAVNFDERTATHQAMIGPDFTPLVPPLSREWNDLAQRYDALADQSDALYAELSRRAEPIRLSGCTCGGIGDTGSHFAGCAWAG